LLNIEDDFDQKFMWVVPSDKTGNSQLALKAFRESYYLAFEDDGKATLREGDISDRKENSIIRFQNLQTTV